MTQVDYIKHLRNNEGASISEIARRVGCCWETAKKYADGDIDLQKRGRRKRKKTVMEGYEEDIIDILVQDQREEKKQRRTAKVIFKELKKLGYQGSYRTVRGYVRKAKEELRLQAREQFAKLEHFPGEAQVDFGEFKAINNGMEKSYYELILSFPHSNAQVCIVLPSENMVCFLYGLQTLFQLIGGVPKIIWFDNLSAAVAKILSGTDRSLTEMFKTFQWHYRFRAEFCNPGKGNEKGNVECKVGYVRRNNFSPRPIIEDLEEFNNELHERMLEDWDREHYTKGALISELWEDDRNHLLTLPTSPLEIVRFHTRVINKYGEIKINEQLYRVPNVSPGQKVLIKEYWERLEILDIYGEKLLHTCPRVYLQKAENIDWAAELEIFIRRPRAAERAVYLRALPDSVKDYILSAKDLKERRQRIIAAVEVLRQHPLDIVVLAVEKALEYGRTDINSLRVFAAAQAGAQMPGAVPLEEPWTPSEVAEWQPDLSIYDALGVATCD